MSQISKTDTEVRKRMTVTGRCRNVWRFMNLLRPHICNEHTH